MGGGGGGGRSGGGGERPEVVVGEVTDRGGWVRETTGKRWVSVSLVEFYVQSPRERTTFGKSHRHQVEPISKAG